MTTLWQASQQLRAGDLTASAATQQALRAAEQPSGEGARVFTRTYADSAVQQAQQADTRWQQQQPRSPIDGLPISIKDLFDVADEPTCAGSRVLADAPPRRRRATRISCSG
jgi:aspartyl-tRNA(Asn)/glutamyl-tRNA(Gln) amidotransferase subunit A